MNTRWERKLAAEVARTLLERECCTDSIVSNYMMMAREGDIDLLTALTECIKTLVKFRIEALDMLSRQVGLIEMYVGEDHVSLPAEGTAPTRPLPDPFIPRSH